MNREKPIIIREVGFDFSWDEQKVWALKVSSEKMPIENLVWHFDVPFLWSRAGGYYDLKPQAVIDHPEQYPEEYARTMQADTSYPIDVMFYKQRWLILDGLHRLMKQSIEGATEVTVRKIPKGAIPEIQK